MNTAGFADSFAALLNEVDLVTFDVFDTALVRGLRQPDDLFLQLTLAGVSEGLLSHALCVRIAQARRDAEREVRRRAWRQESRGEVRLDEIYAELGVQLDIENEVLDHLMRIETKLELAQNDRNRLVGKLHDDALRAGKRTGFLSDMYLDEALVRQLLTRGGYSGFTFVHVSSTTFDTKARGTLYQRILRDYGVEPSRWLHIGDNLDSDVAVARRIGIRTVHYEKCASRLRNDPVANRRHNGDSPLRGDSPESRVFGSICAGLVSGRAFCNPDTSGIDSDADLWIEWGYRHVGPLLAGFGTWLVHQLCRSNVSRAYFLARDGYLIKNAVDRILAAGAAKNYAIATAYLYASRRSYNFASITRVDDDSLEFLAGGTSRLTPRQFLARIDIDIDRHPEEIRQAGLTAADHPVSGARGRRRLRELLRLLEPQIVDQAQAEFTTLKRYFAEQGLVDQAEAAIVDLGWHGSLQRAIERLIARIGSNARTIGLYLGTFAPARRYADKGMMMRGYLCENGLPTEMDRSIKLSVEIIEWIFSAPHGSVRRFVTTPDGVQPLLAELDFEPARWERASAVQCGALEFLDDYLRKWGGFDLPEVPPQDAVRTLIRALSRPTLAEATALGDMKHVEGFGHVAVERYIARPPGSLRDPRTYPRLLLGYRDAFWRPGYARRMLGSGHP
ncbi:MAG: HAD-IA family hydrolase [Sterolibacteriaceae bacterium]|uniref:HAD-IA family hydrolase n=1 Tax=Candidatus Methylophosphatis roskildensis TaxID=2899263 RepID=A0A9D7E7A6_9PROT|nr:HAD-IA family hydrolase [Candidatus Methylophosphatis roskildensis]MBK7234762.1 HAD-IA family hydrolase [Sterolibacteriaceae bacterium]